MSLRTDAGAEVPGVRGKMDVVCGAASRRRGDHGAQLFCKFDLSISAGINPIAHPHALSADAIVPIQAQDRKRPLFDYDH
jgi:hypothetical protein